MQSFLDTILWDNDAADKSDGNADKPDKQTDKSTEPPDDKKDKSDKTADKRDESLIPRWRFDEVIGERNEAQADLKAREKAEKEAGDNKLLEEKKYQELLTSKNDELKKSQDEKAALEARIKTDSINSAVKVAALEAGTIDVELAVKAINPEEVKLGADGVPENVGKLVEKLKKDKPHLFGEPGKKPSTSNPPQPGAGKPTDDDNVGRGLPAVAAGVIKHHSGKGK